MHTTAAAAAAAEQQQHQQPTSRMNTFFSPPLVQAPAALTPGGTDTAVDHGQADATLTL